LPGHQQGKEMQCDVVNTGRSVYVASIGFLSGCDSDIIFMQLSHHLFGDPIPSNFSQIGED